MCNAKITFVVPCFNSEHLMTKCLNSLKNQTFNDVEFVFVDDGSKDKTKDIIQDFIKIEPRARLIIQENQGITAARLAGLKATNTKYVAFVDSDDHIDIELAGEAYSKFESDEYIDAILYGFVYLKDNEKNIFQLDFNFPIEGIDVIAKTIPSWKIYTNGLYRTIYALDAYSKIKIKSTNSDEVANRLIFEKCRKVEKIKANYYYVQYPSSTSKYPSKNYITRLESAYWLRNYANRNWSDRVSKHSSDVLFINELCSLALKYADFKKDMPYDVKVEWEKGLLKYRKYAISAIFKASFKYPIKFFKDYKLIKKSVYILVMPFFVG